MLYRYTGLVIELQTYCRAYGTLIQCISSGLLVGCRSLFRDLNQRISHPWISVDRV